MKTFVVSWYKNVKFGEPITRYTEVKTIDAQAALQLCMKMNGNLKKITVIQIQEINPVTLEPVGEPIKPMDMENK